MSTDTIERTNTVSVGIPTFTLPASQFRDVLTGCSSILAAGRDALPALDVVHIEVSDGTLNGVSTDRYRLAVGTVKAEHDEVAEFSITRIDALAIIKMLPKAPRGKEFATATVTVDMDARAYTVEYREFGSDVSRFVWFGTFDGGTFPKWRTLIPEKFGEIDGISFNLDRMASVAKIPHEKGATITWQFVGEDRPALATFPEFNSVAWRYLLMPVRVASE